MTSWMDFILVFNVLVVCLLLKRPDVGSQALPEPEMPVNWQSFRWCTDEAGTLRPRRRKRRRPGGAGSADRVREPRVIGAARALQPQRVLPEENRQPFMRRAGVIEIRNCPRDRRRRQHDRPGKRNQRQHVEIGGRHVDDGLRHLPLDHARAAGTGILRGRRLAFSGGALLAAGMLRLLRLRRRLGTAPAGGAADDERENQCQQT